MRAEWPRFPLSPFKRGKWAARERRLEAAATTTDPAQPKGGFTISIEETKQEVAMLRAAYEQGDFEARQMIRKMAAMSISTAEGIPTRRYTP